MADIISKLNELKSSSVKGELSIDEIQRKLSILLLDNCDSQERENAAKKFDNDLELVIYTLNTENQLDAAVKVIDEAIGFMDK